MVLAVLVPMVVVVTLAAPTLVAAAVAGALLAVALLTARRRLAWATTLDSGPLDPCCTPNH